MPWDRQVWSDVNKLLINSSKLLIGGTVHGHLPSGKNNYRLSGKKLFKANKVGSYESDFAKQIGVMKYYYRDTVFPIEGKTLCLLAEVYFKDWRRDVDTILFCDLLQKCGIVKNDRAIRIKILNGSDVDAKNPRVEFRLYAIKEGL